MRRCRHTLFVVIVSVGLLLTACSTYSPPPPVSTPTVAPQLTLEQRFEAENPGAKVLQSFTADLDRDGTEELVVAYQPKGSQDGVVAILPAAGALIQVDSINIAKAIQPLKILDLGKTVHLAVIIGLGHNYYVHLYAFDGKGLCRA